MRRAVSGFRSMIPLLAAMLLPLAAGACLEAPRDPIRIGINAWPPFELLYLAREKGFFQEEGVEVDLVDFSSYTGILRSYHQGNVDAFLATLNETLIADNFQDPPAVVLVVDYSYGGDALVARDGVTDIAALRGRRVAFEESALGSFVLERALETGGLTLADIVPVNRLPEEGERDFLAREVDAVVTYEPALNRLMRQPGARTVFSSRDIPGEIVDVLVLRRSILEGRQAEAARVLKAWFRALAWYRENPQEAAAMMAKRQHIGVEEFLAGLSGAHLPDLEENRRLLGTAQAPGPIYQTADRLGAFLMRHGLAKQATAAADLFHPELVDSL